MADMGGTEARELTPEVEVARPLQVSPDAPPKGVASHSAAERGVLAASSWYFLAQMLTVAGGFVSMPILTRFLDRSEYGLLNLTWASIGVVVLVARLGFPSATTRFYYEWRDRGGRKLRAFCGAMLVGAFTGGLLVALATAVGGSWIAAGSPVVRCLQLACLIAVTRVVSAVIYQIYRVEERVLAFSLFKIGSRYVTLALVVVFLLADLRDAYDVILATVLAEGCLTLVCVLDLRLRGAIGWPHGLGQHVRTAASYGLPLVIGGAASLFLEVGDRFLIEHYMGLSAVATYTVPYDLADTAAGAVFGSLKLAVVPAILLAWTRQGHDAASQLVSEVFTYSIALAIPAATLFMLLNKDIIVVIASAKYASSAGLTAYLLPGVLIGQIDFLMSVGLMLEKRTMVLGTLSLCAGGLNLILNLFLLPYWGLVGAALATTISYAALFVATYQQGRHALRLHLRYETIGKGIVTALVLTATLWMIGDVSVRPAVNLFLQGLVGGLVILISMLTLDRPIRAQAVEQVRLRWRSRVGS